MLKSDVIAKLRTGEQELRAMGVEQLALFGSTARGEARPDSDVDLAVRLEDRHNLTLLDFVAIKLLASEMLGTQVDLVTEPSRRPRLQAEIDRDRVHVF